MAVPFRLVHPESGKVVYEGVTYDATHDRNDYVIVEQPVGTRVRVQWRLENGGWEDGSLVEFSEKPVLMDCRTVQ